MLKLLFFSLFIVTQSFIFQKWTRPIINHKVAVLKPLPKVWSPVLRAASNDFNFDDLFEDNEKEDVRVSESKEKAKIDSLDNSSTQKAEVDDLFGDEEVIDTEAWEPENRVQFTPKIPDITTEDMDEMLAANDNNSETENDIDVAITKYAYDEKDVGIMGESESFHEIGLFDGQPVEEYPMYALIYRFREKYYNEEMADLFQRFDAYCLDFTRVFNKDQVKMSDSRGLVIMFGGNSINDREETLAEMKIFMEKDPFMLEDIVEKYDLVNMNGEEEFEESLDNPSTVLLPKTAEEIKKMKNQKK